MRIFSFGIVFLTIGILGFTQIALSQKQPESLDVEISSKGVGTVRATLILPAPRVRVRRVLMDYANWPKLFPQKPTIHYIKKLKGRVRVGMTLPAFILPITLRLVTETRQPKSFYIVTEMVEGDFDRYDWVWDLTSTDNGLNTQAKLTLNVKPKFWTPDWSLKMILQSDLEEHFKLLRQALTHNDPRQSEEPPQKAPQ